MEQDMALVDWMIVVIIALAMLGGFKKGFFCSFCSLGGLLIGLLLASWNYASLAALLVHLVRIRPVANTISFLVIALLVMQAISIAGAMLSKTLHRIGLGFLDRLAGAVFGFLQGSLLVTLCILATVAFFPQAHWLIKAKLPKMFFGICHLSTHVSPSELAERVRWGLRMLEEGSPHWLHSHSGGL